MSAAPDAEPRGYGELLNCFYLQHGELQVSSSAVQQFLRVSAPPWFKQFLSLQSGRSLNTTAGSA